MTGVLKLLHTQTAEATGGCYETEVGKLWPQPDSKASLAGRTAAANKSESLSSTLIFYH